METGIFRPLEADKCRIIWKRHLAHKQNMTAHPEQYKYRQGGLTLADEDIEFDAAYCSPQGRAVATVYFTLEGNGGMVPIETDRRLDALDEVGPERAKALKDRARKLGVKPFAFLSHQKYDAESSLFVDKNRLERGQEGTAALREIAVKHAGQNVLVAGHNGYRMEPTVLVLQNPGVTDSHDLPDPDFLVEEGQIIELILKKDGTLVECRYRPIDQPW